MYRSEDGYGVILFAEKCMRYNGIDIFITLPTEQHRHAIGRVNYDTNTLYILRDSTKHVLKSHNAYGINHYVLKIAKSFDKVVIIETDTDSVYRVEKRFLLSEGQFLVDSQKGLRKQLFITREWLQYYAIKTQDGKIIARSEYRIPA
jgi:hypothetical protein